MVTQPQVITSNCAQCGLPRAHGTYIYLEYPEYPEGILIYKAKSAQGSKLYPELP